MKQRLLIVMILLAPLLVGFAPERQQAAITLDVSAGYDDYYRQGQWVPVRVNVSNTGANLDGYVRVRVDDLGSLEETTYQTPISLPKGSRKQVFLYVSLGNYALEVSVELVDEDNRVVARETAPLRMVSEGDLLYAVITESMYGAVDLAAEPVGNGTVRQINWRIDDLPAQADALAGLDVIMFHDVDTGDLRAEQVAALSMWVLRGGHLIVAGGDAWQRTTAQLADLLPVTLQGSELLDAAAALGTYMHQSSAMLDEPMTTTLVTPDAVAQVLVAVEDQPVIVRGEYGSGWVDFIAVDPNTEPLRSWTGMSELWYMLIISVGQQVSWINGISDWSLARDATLTTSSSVLPTIIQLCGFLTAYIALIGPVNYLVLKRLTRREWAWVSIPALIVLFSVLAYRVGFNLRGSMPVVNRLSVVQVWPQHEEAQIETLVGVQSPRRTYYDVIAERGAMLRTLPEEGIGINVPVTVNEGTRYEAQRILIDGGTVASLVASETGSAPALDSAVEWRLSSDEVPRIIGTVTNTTGSVLEDTVVLVKGEVRALGTLDPGQSAAFDIPIGPQASGALTLGATYLWQNPYSYISWGRSNSISRCFAYSGLPLTVPDVMQGEAFACSVSQVSDREHEIRRRYRLLGALIADDDESGGRDSGAYLFAWSRQPVVDITVGNRSQQTEDTALYVFDLPVSVVGTGNYVEIPSALTTWTLTEIDDPSTMRDVHPELSLQVDSSNQAAFLFMPLTHIRLARVNQLLLQFAGQGDVAVELWNWDAQVWQQVDLSTQSDTTVIVNAARFVGPENAVKVRLSATASVSYNRVQYIKVGYRGWLAE